MFRVKDLGSGEKGSRFRVKDLGLRLTCRGMYQHGLLDKNPSSRTSIRLDKGPLEV